MREDKRNQPGGNTGSTASGVELARPLALPLDELDAGMILLVGGKAANLGEMLHAGLPVPPGFCVTTAAYELVSLQAQLDTVLSELDSVGATDTSSLHRCAADIRAAVLGAAIPSPAEEAVRQAYADLLRDVGSGMETPVPVAVRSSATAEDLPFASFAGQQDTYLNIVGVDGVLDAVKRCWASLWTDRAVSYRATNDIDQRTVSLAVVVQAMVDAQAAGVLFTANPLTGKRRQAVIDSSGGLGEAVVSGAVNPDHFVADPRTGEILERRVGDKRVAVRPLPGGGTERVEMAGGGDKPSITDEQVVALARLGARVEEYFGAPQDIEWAIDGAGVTWLTQSRPITTLYPLPEGAPLGEDELRAYFSINVAQGVFRPFTPMGLATFRLMISSGAILAGFPPPDPVAGPRVLIVAGQRLFMDVTTMLRSELGPRFLGAVMGKMEARSSVLFERLTADPRLAPIPTPRRVAMERLLQRLPRFRRVPLYLVQALVSPAAARRRLRRVEKRLRTLGTVPDGTTSEERLDTFEQMLVENTAPLLLSALPIIMAVFGLPAVLARLLRGLATEEEMHEVLRSLPYNPTTEMDLALWKLARRVGDAPGAADLFRDLTPEQLAERYREGRLPATLQRGLGDFLRVYGHRAVAEIDLGLPRWSEDPSYILGAIGSYLQIKDPNMAPSVQFRRGAEAARAMRNTLAGRARKQNRLRGALVSFCLDRIHRLTGLREMPKFLLVLLMSRGRQLLLPVGEELARAGRLDQPEDIFFIDTREAREGLAGKDLRGLVEQRRASYRQELSRRHIPRVLMSDGTDPEMAVANTAGRAAGEGDVLEGTPASGGVVTGKARVVLEPEGARLEPGEILVAPSTDPGWTPLFLTAGGLVMEMGGSMSHGAVVAREYGIPAVVGLPGATERIATGEEITVDGSRGTVSTAGVTLK